MMKAQFVPAWQSGRAQFKAAYWALFSDDELAFLVAYMQEHLMIPTTEQIAAAVWSAAEGQFVSRFGRNKFITDPVTGLATLYADDGTTVLAQGEIFEDAAGTQPYRGKGAERRERLT